MGNEVSLNTTNGICFEYRPKALNNGSGTGTVFGFGIDDDYGLTLKSYVGTHTSAGPSTEATFRCNMDGEWSTEGTLTSEDNESSGTVRVGGIGSHVDQVTGRCRTKLNSDGLTMKLGGGVKRHRSSYDEEQWCLEGELSEENTRVAGRVAGRKSVGKAWAEIEDDGLTMRAGGYFGRDSAGGFLNGRLNNGLNMAIGGAVDKSTSTFGYGVGFQDNATMLNLKMAE
ncbi:hypothetical protein CHS0354_002950 [Potamilus streckersoni]|uniref:Uncharacterized protein n=1 Tax=Potamilus streckersoni TaxID=2493646 RepID=A0AAE0RS67_9BIVA|nr:hypothetical protein CHS0354_002950 [Potamilus streckersoni]